jgi:hypothetical protein
MRFLAIAIVLATATAQAGPRAPRTAVKPRPIGPETVPGPVDANKLVPGTCAYVQAGVKVCSALPDGHGAFDVVTALPAAIFVRTEDPIVNFVPPDPHYYQADKRDTSVVIAPVAERLPDTTPTILTTKTLTITLRLHPGLQRDADTQLSIRDPLRSQRSAEVMQAVAAAEKRTAGKLGAELRDGELEAIARQGVSVTRPKGHTITRNTSFAVLEARQVVYLGDRRLLLFVLENRGGDRFQLAGVRLWIGERPVSSLAWKFDRAVVEPAAEARGVLELPLNMRPAKVKLVVDELDPRRSVELDGIEVR